MEKRIFQIGLIGAEKIESRVGNQKKLIKINMEKFLFVKLSFFVMFWGNLFFTCFIASLNFVISIASKVST